MRRSHAKLHVEALPGGGRLLERCHTNPRVYVLDFESLVNFSSIESLL
jgi:hypothetical protein